MKTSRLILFLAALVALPSLVSAASSPGLGRVRAILIVASNKKADADPKLAAYEAKLQGLLRFQSYRWVAEGTTAVSEAGTATVALVREHRVELTTDGKAIRATWFEGAKKVLALNLPEGPAIVGGPAWNDQGDVCAIILVREGAANSGK